MSDDATPSDDEVTRLAAVINEALKGTAGGQRHVHAARNGCPGCAHQAALAVLPLLRREQHARKTIAAIAADRAHYRSEAEAEVKRLRARLAAERP